MAKEKRGGVRKEGKCKLDKKKKIRKSRVSMANNADKYSCIIFSNFKICFLPAGFSLLTWIK